MDTFRALHPSTPAIAPSFGPLRLAVMMHIRFPLSLRNVEDLLRERGIEVRHETIRFWF